MKGRGERGEQTNGEQAQVQRDSGTKDAWLPSGLCPLNSPRTPGPAHRTPAPGPRTS